MRKWIPLIAVCLGTFMLLVDVTIVTVALPDMARRLDTTFTDLQWVMDLYALALAALLLGAGSLADRVGQRRVYLVGLVLFTAASLACGLAGNATELIAFRGVQGIGGAAMLATTVALISHLYQGRDRGTAFGVWGAVNGAAAAAGPILGGLLTQHLDWRWIFFVNLPIGIAALVMTVRVIPGYAAKPAPGERVDFAGLVTFTIAAAAITFALIKGNDYGWTSTRTIGLFAGGAAALCVFVFIELRTNSPLLDLSLFRAPTFTGTMIGALLLSVAAFSYLAYSSLWLQSVLGMSPVTAGLCFLPMSIAAFITASLAGRFLEHASPQWLIGGGLVLIGAGALMQAAVGASSSWTVLIAGLAVSGVGVGLSTPSLASTAVAAVGYQRAGMASGAVNTARQLGNALGIAVLGVVFHDGLSSALSGPAAGATANALASGQSQALLAHTAPGAQNTLSHQIHVAFAHGLQSTFLVAGALGLVGALFALLLIRKAKPQASQWSATQQGQRETSGVS